VYFEPGDVLSGTTTFTPEPTGTGESFIKALNGDGILVALK
jgi:hypothetical protein